MSRTNDHVEQSIDLIVHIRSEHHLITGQVIKGLSAIVPPETRHLVEKTDQLKNWRENEANEFLHFRVPLPSPLRGCAKELGEESYPADKLIGNTGQLHANVRFRDRPFRHHHHT